MLGLPWDAKIDMWSLGCLLVELMLGYPLFHGSSVAAVLAAQQAVLGPHPDKILEQSPRETARMYFAPNGVLYVVDPHHRPPGAYELVPTRTSLEALLNCHDEKLLDFLTQLLTYDAAERPSAKQALQHPFISSHLAERQQQQQYAQNAHRSKARQRSSSDELVEKARKADGPVSSSDEADGASSPVGSWSGHNDPQRAIGHTDYVAGYDSSFSSVSHTGSSVASSAENSPQGSPQTTPRTLNMQGRGGGGAGGRHHHASRGKDGGARGPGVPEEFRNAIVNRHDARGGRNSHDWKERIVRFLKPAQIGGASSSGGSRGKLGGQSSSGSGGEGSPQGSPDGSFTRGSPDLSPEGGGGGVAKSDGYVNTSKQQSPPNDEQPASISENSRPPTSGGRGGGGGGGGGHGHAGGGGGGGGDGLANSIDHLMVDPRPREVGQAWMSGGDANSDGGAGSGNEQPGPLEGLRQLTQPFLTNLGGASSGCGASDAGQSDASDMSIGPTVLSSSVGTNNLSLSDGFAQPPGGFGFTPIPGSPATVPARPGSMNPAQARTKGTKNASPPAKGAK